MSDIDIRIEGRAGRITLNRPKVLNALTYEMCMAIDAALVDWQDDPRVALVLIDATGEKAFCAGGDIADIYEAGLKQEYDYPRKFWRDEYRMNARLKEYTKPVISFLQGFVMGGGVGAGCHGSDRIVCDSTHIAMPECAIGLVPDVGGTLMLATAPGHLGEFLSATGYRMGSGDAIFCGFADTYIPEDKWEQLKALLVETGDRTAVDAFTAPAPDAPLRGWQSDLDTAFSAPTFAEAVSRLSSMTSEPAATATKLIDKNAPLAMTCGFILTRNVRKEPTIRNALEWEYRFTSRVLEFGDMVEGIRAAIIDKDKSPKWMHPSPAEVPQEMVDRMLAPVDGPQVTF